MTGMARLVTGVARLAALGAVVVAGACSDEGPVSGPGTMTATLAGPNAAEGAAVVALLGDGVGDISPIGSTEVYARAANGSTRIVLINPNGGELSFRVAVSDTTQPPAAVVEQVAGPDDELRASLETYSLELSR